MMLCMHPVIDETRSQHIRICFGTMQVSCPAVRSSLGFATLSGFGGTVAESNIFWGDGEKRGCKCQAQNCMRALLLKRGVRKNQTSTTKKGSPFRTIYRTHGHAAIFERTIYRTRRHAALFCSRTNNHLLDLSPRCRF